MAKVLLGFMGVGKSSVAPFLDGRFVDMDQVIEEKIGMSIAASFDVVYDRIQKDTKNQRPLFLNHSKEDFKAIYDGRMALYQDLADLVVTVDNRTPEEVARFIKCM